MNRLPVVNNKINHSRVTLLLLPLFAVHYTIEHLFFCVSHLFVTEECHTRIVTRGWRYIHLLWRSGRTPKMNNFSTGAANAPRITVRLIRQKFLYLAKIQKTTVWAVFPIRKKILRRYLVFRENRRPFHLQTVKSAYGKTKNAKNSCPK